MFNNGTDPRSIVKQKALQQITDSAQIIAVIEEVILENPSQVEAYRGGKTRLLGFFVGQVMKKTEGKANPDLVNSLLEEKLR